MKSSSRRKFIASSAKAGIATMIAVPVMGSYLSSFAEGIPSVSGISDFKTGFDQTPLPFAYNALEPWIDTLTMDIHYNKHAGAYSKNLKEAAAAEKVDIKMPLEDVLNKISSFSTKMRNNGGGHYNHEMFWKSLTPSGNTEASAKLTAAILSSFGTMDEFKKQFSDAAKSRFGSGWAWLIIDSKKMLKVISTANQDNPLMDIAEVKGFPLIGLDVWEHAYYLKYQNKRVDYVNAWWNLVNWEQVAQNFSAI